MFPVDGHPRPRPQVFPDGKGAVLRLAPQVAQEVVSAPGGIIVYILRDIQPRRVVYETVQGPVSAGKDDPCLRGQEPEKFPVVFDLRHVMEVDFLPGEKVSDGAGVFLSPAISRVWVI